ncbi:MAG TPA: pyrroline-5-carboxylate reductase [Pseudomonadales bacterium]|nr:pyrroline-5-carboxylate reductase [Pseudomonadales bacterium]
MNYKNIAFIGAGNMASSLVAGLVSQGWPAQQIFVSDPVVEQCQRLASAHGVQICADNKSATLHADVLVLAVKPQLMKTVLGELRETLKQQRPLLISIAAGITLSNLADETSPDLAAVRCMPNTPAMVGLGATALVANPNCSQENKNLAQTILSAVGTALWLSNEAQMDAVTALSGSGPAYYFLMMEAMISAGVALGLDAETASTLTLQTALGAATMARHSDVPPAELRRRVTSPGGTTEQALQRFEQGNFMGLVREAMQAAEQRSQALATPAAKS